MLVQIELDPNSQIAIIWNISDVQSVRPDLSDDEALVVLKKAEKMHDSEQGINWDILKIWADELYPIY